MKLNSEQAKAAWVDYKEFMGFDSLNPGTYKHIEQAFKYAFALGQETRKEEVKQPIEVKVPNIKIPDIPKFNAAMEQLRLPLQNNRKATGITRTYNGRVRRTHNQRKNEAALVASILKTKGKEMYLQDIRHAVNAHGCNWKEQSVTGYINDAMERFPQIKKVGHGIYAYEE